MNSQAALAALIYRANTRTAFGRLLAKKDTIRQIVAEARIEITKCRLLCYLAATVADEKGFKARQAHIIVVSKWANIWIRDAVCPQNRWVLGVLTKTRVKSSAQKNLFNFFI